MAQQLPHGISLQQRQKLEATGVTEVASFEEDAAVITTGLGTLVVQGQGLQLKNLDLEGGRVTVEGQINALSYEEPRAAGWLRRLLG